MLAYAASSELHSRHPLAEAVIRSTEERRITIPPHEECEVLVGLGMRTWADGRTLLLLAPYGSHLSSDSPHIRLAGGYGPFDAGDSVELSGWVDDVWKAVGTSAPTEWRRCVGGRGDHEVMLVVATNDR